MPDVQPPVIGSPYIEGLDTQRFDGGFVAQTLLKGQYVLTARGSATWQHQQHRYGDTPETDQNNTAFGEVSLRGRATRQTWVAGVAFERNTLAVSQLRQFDHVYNVPGLFAQDDIDVARWMSVSASGRVDVHNEFGAFVSPRVSALFRGGPWSSRASIGTGFFAPSPQTDETAAAGLARLSVPIPLTVERGQSASWDLTRSFGPISITATVFHSRIKDPVVLDRERYMLANVAEPTINSGVELLATFRQEDFSITSTYTFVDAVEGAGVDRGGVPLTPRHSIGLFGVWESEGAGRVAFETYYTGHQRLEDNPYRTESVPYILFGVLVEWRFGKVRVFVNGENIGNVRQTDWDPLIRPTRGVVGRWTVDARAPLDGRVMNGGIKRTF